MLKKVAFTMYPVENLNRAKDFYKNNLGLTPSNISANGNWVEYDLPQGGCFAITTLAEGVTPSSVSGGSIAFEVEDLDSLTQQLKENGVTFKLDVSSSPVCRMAIIIDSEGNAITLHQIKKESNQA
ncbi:TPA: VOC family protein [Legionella pneumophila]|nr:VOC family protein [Legionella pneumophila]HAT9136418.1 VOC family protein [Legionella pneumophila subsp. pneumophila]HAU0937182.1 VOC family protein [Legionella pneumophila]HAU1689049.1 VOC family protein [Legionella pneumophila]HCJ1124948.1 VOC family protein [Legionella pneumophila]